MICPVMLLVALYITGRAKQVDNSTPHKHRLFHSINKDYVTTFVAMAKKKATVSHK